MSIDYEELEEFKAVLVDKYTPIEIAELLIEHFELTEYDVLDIFGDDRVMELRFR